MTDTDYDIATIDVGDGWRAVLAGDPEPWDGIDPVRDSDHAGVLVAWGAGYHGREVGPHDAATVRAWNDWPILGDPDWSRFEVPARVARELTAEVSAAGGVVVPVRFDDYGSSGQRFGRVDSIDDANGLLVILAATVAEEWPIPAPDAVPGGSTSYADHWHAHGYRSSRDAAVGYADAFIGEVGAWVAGHVYCYRVETGSGETVDAVYGYIGADPWKPDDWMRADAVAEAEWWRDAIAYHRAVLAAAIEGPDLSAALRVVAESARIDRATEPGTVTA